jgi:hypothetical protein
MRLNLLFIAMDMLTLLAYPILFVYTKIYQFSRFRQDVAVANLLVPSPVIPDSEVFRV